MTCLTALHFFHWLFSVLPLQQHVTFDPAGSYAVENLKPDTLYRFSLAARSEMGLGVYTQPVEARTAQSSKSESHVSLLLPLSSVSSATRPLTTGFAERRCPCGGLEQVLVLGSDSVESLLRA